MFYRNVTIENNVIVNGHLHGITVGASDGLVIRNNTVLRGQAFARGDDREKTVRIPRIRVAGKSTNVTITGNMAARFPRRVRGWVQRDNIIVQDISTLQSGYYGAVFADALEGDPGDLRIYRYLPGVVPPQVGAPRLRAR